MCFRCSFCGTQEAGGSTRRCRGAEHRTLGPRGPRAEPEPRRRPPEARARREEQALELRFYLREPALSRAAILSRWQAAIGALQLSQPLRLLAAGLQVLQRAPQLDARGLLSLERRRLLADDGVVDWRKPPRGGTEAEEEARVAAVEAAEARRRENGFLTNLFGWATSLAADMLDDPVDDSAEEGAERPPPAAQDSSSSGPCRALQNCYKPMTKEALR